MSAQVKKVVLRTPASVGATDQYSALQRCRTYAVETQDAAQAAVSANVSAQAASAVSVAARDTALASVGAVKATRTDASASVLDECLLVEGPLNKTVDNPGGDETITLSLSAMTGATASGAGLPGAVPAPQAGDGGRYLRGDGLWITPDRSELGMALVEDTWTVLAGPLTVLSGSRAAVPGDQTGMAPSGRAIRPDVPEGVSGYVETAAYDAGEDRTVLSVGGFVLDGSCQGLSVGQDPANAPLQGDSTGADLALVSLMASLTY